MANLYSTKALGRAWPPSTPTASPRTSSRGRFIPWDLNPPRQRPPAVEESWFQDFRLLRGRLTERLVLILVLIFCAAFLIRNHEHLISPGTRAWVATLHVSRLSGSLLPPWSRVGWSDYAYVSYATTPDYLCNSVMLAESLHRLGAKPDTLILYSSDLTTSSSPHPASARLIYQATALYGAHTEPVSVLSASSSSFSSSSFSSSTADTTWSASFTKLLAFNQTRYRRVLSLDSDATLLHPLDELFLLPPTAPVALSRAYWLNNTLCTSVLLASPSEADFARVRARVEKAAPQEVDTDVINALYGDGCLVVPHRPYLLLSGEMRAAGHEAYLGGGGGGEWDAVKVLAEAKYVHFSDWPMPKPWMASSEGLRRELMPGCKGVGEGDCGDRDVWVGLYAEFRERRKASLFFSGVQIFGV